MGHNFESLVQLDRRMEYGTEWRNHDTFRDMHPLTQVDPRGQRWQMLLHHLWGGEDYARLRPLSMPGTDCFVVTFDLDNLAQFRDIEAYWLPELRQHSPGVPWIILGMKKEVRDSAAAVSLDEANQTAQRLGAAQYLECSMERDEGLDQLLDCCWSTARQYHIGPTGPAYTPPKSSGRCSIL